MNLKALQRGADFRAYNSFKKIVNANAAASAR
jgi:hypothetical protein